MRSRAPLARRRLGLGAQALEAGQGAAQAAQGGVHVPGAQAPFVEAAGVLVRGLQLFEQADALGEQPLGLLHLVAGARQPGLDREELGLGEAVAQLLDPLPRLGRVLLGAPPARRARSARSAREMWTRASDLLGAGRLLSSSRARCEVDCRRVQVVAVLLDQPELVVAGGEQVAVAEPPRRRPGPRAPAARPRRCARACGRARRAGRARRSGRGAPACPPGASGPARSAARPAASGRGPPRLPPG